jgi:hypothetical protein
MRTYAQGANLADELVAAPPVGGNESAVLAVLTENAAHARDAAMDDGIDNRHARP